MTFERGEKVIRSQAFEKGRELVQKGKNNKKTNWL
jgi:hypothetical protein